MQSGRRHRFLFTATILLSSGCAARAPNPAELPAREFAGHLTITEDGYWFRPCTAQHERWWVTLTDRSIEQVRDALAEGRIEESGPAFVRWRAALTDERLVGPGGPALLAREVLEIRRAGDADCDSAAGVSPDRSAIERVRTRVEAE